MIVKTYTSIAVTVLVVAVVGACSPSENQEATDPSTAVKPEAPEAAPVEMSQLAQQGEAVYGQYCVACHQTDGQGMSGAFPPLTQTKWVEGEKAELIGVILNGLQGPITVKGEEYNNVMASHDFLSDEDIAAVLTYVRQSFGNNVSEVTPEEVANVRASAEEGATAN